MSPVLSDKRICDLAASDKMIEPFFPQRVRPAGYDVAAARDGLVLPDGDEYPEGKREFDGVVVLEPGDMAELSSQESFRMPHRFAGNLALKSSYARKGLILLSGLLIDPGYGLNKAARLRFYVANVGNKTIEIEPKKDGVVAVQFLEVAGDALPTRRPVDQTPPWTRGKHGFLQDLKSVSELKNQLDRLHLAFEWVVLLAILVIAATIFGVTLESLLGVTDDPSLVEDVRAAMPDETSDKWLLGAIFGSVAVSLLSLAVLVGPLGTGRRRGLAAAAFLALIYAPVAVSLSVYVIESEGYGQAFWPVWSLLPAVVLALPIGAYKLWKARERRDRRG